MNLHQLALETVRESASPDPGVMAEDLVNRIPAGEYRDALLMMARAYVCDVIRSQRTALNGGGRSSGSRKVEAARAAWKRLLDVPEYVPSIGAWIALRDATREQVLEMAALRQAKAAENLAVAERYEAIAKAMRREGVKTAADLGERFLETLLAPQGAAA